MGGQKLIVICGSPCVGKSAAADLHENIRTKILEDITEKGYQTIGFTLTCSEEVLRQRHRARGDENECSMEWLRLPHYPGDHVIDTDGKTPRQVAEEMKDIIDSYGDIFC